MNNTIPKPTEREKLAIYNGVIRWFAPEVDRHSGEIAEQAAITEGSTWSWAQLGLIVNAVGKKKIDIFRIVSECPQLPKPKLNPITIETVWSGFICDVISGAGLGSDQERDFWGALVQTTANQFRVSEEEARNVDLRYASPSQIAEIDAAFHEQTKVNYVAYVVRACTNNPHPQFLIRDLLPRIYKELA